MHPCSTTALHSLRPHPHQSSPDVAVPSVAVALVAGPGVAVALVRASSVALQRGKQCRKEIRAQVGAVHTCRLQGMHNMLSLGERKQTHIADVVVTSVAIAVLQNSV